VTRLLAPRHVSIMPSHHFPILPPPLIMRSVSFAFILSLIIIVLRMRGGAAGVCRRFFTAERRRRFRYDAAMPPSLHMMPPLFFRRL